MKKKKKKKIFLSRQTVQILSLTIPFCQCRNFISDRNDRFIVRECSTLCSNTPFDQFLFIRWNSREDNVVAPPTKWPVERTRGESIPPFKIYDTLSVESLISPQMIRRRETMKGVGKAENLELPRVTLRICIVTRSNITAFDAVYAFSSPSILMHVSSILQWYLDIVESK